MLVQSKHNAAEFKQQIIAKIEHKLGRVRTENKFAPRTIDIDIMLFNRDILQAGHREIPSDEILERAFVAIPLAEIAPDYVHPVLKKPLKDIAGKFNPEEERMTRRNDIQLESNHGT